MGNILFFLFWIFCVIGTYHLIKNSVKVKENNIKIEIQPPVEINKKLRDLHKSFT